MNIIKGVKFKHNDRIYLCVGIWFIGNKKTQYEFIENSYPNNVLKRNCNIIDDLVKKKEIEIL